MIFGLLLSVPIIIWGSTIILKALDRYPIIILLGAGLLGWIAGGMLVADVYIVEHFGTLSAPVRYGIELLCVAIVIGGGKWLAKRQQR